MAVNFSQNKSIVPREQARGTAAVPYADSIFNFLQQKLVFLSTSAVKKKDLNEIYSNPWA